MTDYQIKQEISSLSHELPGIDTRDALDRLGGSPSMYISFISRFYEEYAESGEVLIACLSRQDLVEAHRLVHTIKSLAGNIGAWELNAKSQSLETSMKRGEIEPSPDSVECFLDELRRVLSQLALFLSTREGRRQV